MPRYNAKLCQRIRNAAKKWDDYFRRNITQYHESFLFVMGEQWSEQESQVFNTYKKIPLTFNKCAPLINNLVGDQRQNTPQLQVTPDEEVPEETAQVREAIVKDISLSSDAKVQYQNAFQQAAIGGFSAILTGTEYDSDYSFDQNIKIESLRDPTRCYWDIGAPDPCKMLGMYSGTRTRMSRKMFRGIYGRKIEASIGSDGNDATLQGFWDDDSITITNHFERKYKKISIHEMSNGKVMDDKQIAELERIEIEGKEYLVQDGFPISILRSRQVPQYTIKHYQIAGNYELESTKFPAKTLLPLSFVDQNSYYDKTGTQICRPFLKDAKDAQRYLNYIGTQQAYLMKVTRYDQFLLSKANVKSADTRQIWTDPLVIQGGLYYDESPSGAKPEQLRPPELPQSLNIQYMRATQDIHECTGMYQAQLGESSNEVSGVAIDARTKTGNKNTFIPFDSLNRAIAAIGCLIDEMIPNVMDTERSLMVNMPDTGMEKIDINMPMDDYGLETKNDMRKGRYKIRLLPGPSYEGQKKEYLESLRLVLQADPEFFRNVADLYAENLPFANNIQLRNRLRTMVPPEIIEAGKTGKPIPPKPTPPDPQQILAQIKQMELQLKMQDAQMKAQQKQQELQLKQMELQAKIKDADREAMAEFQRLETERLETAAQLQEQELRYQAEMHRTNTDQNIAHADNLVKILTHSVKGEPRGKTHEKRL